MKMEQGFRTRVRKFGLTVLTAAALFAANRGEAQNQGGGVNKIGNRIGLDALNPKLDFDMAKYPNLSITEAYEQESWSKMTLEEKRNAVQRALDYEMRNQELDQNDPTVSKEDLEKHAQMMQELRKLLTELNEELNKNQPTV
jgi:hypothetical protein